MRKGEEQRRRGHPGFGDPEETRAVMIKNGMLGRRKEGRELEGADHGLELGIRTLGCGRRSAGWKELIGSRGLGCWEVEWAASRAEEGPEMKTMPRRWIWHAADTRSRCFEARMEDRVALVGEDLNHRHQRVSLFQRCDWSRLGRADGRGAGRGGHGGAL